jgi:hypothetical protein
MERYFFCALHQGAIFKKQKNVCWNVLFRTKLFVPYKNASFSKIVLYHFFYGMPRASFIKKSGVFYEIEKIFIRRLECGVGVVCLWRYR